MSEEEVRPAWVVLAMYHSRLLYKISRLFTCMSRSPWHVAALLLRADMVGC